MFILWTVVVRLAALGLWLLLSAFLLTRRDTKNTWSRRISELAKAIVYFLLAATAYTSASGGSTSSSASASSATAELLAAPGEVVLPVVASLGVLAVAGSFARKGSLKKFTADLSVPNGPTGHLIMTLGIVGYIANGVYCFARAWRAQL